MSDIAAMANRETSTIEKWYSQGLIGQPVQKRPRRWDLDEVEKLLAKRVDGRRTLDDNQVVAVKIRFHNLGQSQKEIATVFGVSVSHISNILNGKRRGI